jgi:hypothetical protein
MPKSLLFKMKQTIEESYPLCLSCTERVSVELERKNRQIRSLYLNSMRQQSNPFTVPTIPHISSNARELNIFLYLVTMTTAIIAIVAYSCASRNMRYL